MKWSNWKQYLRRSPRIIVGALQGERRQRTSAPSEYDLIAQSGLFDTAFYLLHNKLSEEAGRDPIRHYLRYGAAQGFVPNPLFDGSWYLEQSPDVAQKDVNPFLHFVRIGWRERRNPHPLFDTGKYLDENPDVRELGVNPLLHYLQTGSKEARNPHILFDNARYLALNPDVAAHGQNPLAHYLYHGWREDRDPHSLFDNSYYLEQHPELAGQDTNPLLHFAVNGFRDNGDPDHLFDSTHASRPSASPERDLVTESGLFNTAFYLTHHNLSEEARRDPVGHYLARGAAQGLDPNPLFDSRWYLAQNRDVAESGVNPFLHFIHEGWRERRNPHPLFDTSKYLDENPDVRASGVNPLLYYLQTGSLEARNPHVLFNNGRYLALNPDVAAQGQNPLVHYLYHGWLEDRDPHVLFDNSYYLEQNPELIGRNANPLLDFVTGGFRSGNPNHLFDCAYYCALYPDISRDTNPLLHYLEAGGIEMRTPHLLFDAPYYRWKAKGKANDCNPLIHYLESDIAQRTSPHILFDIDFYLEQCPLLLTSGEDPIAHYLREGAGLGLDPCDLFDTSFYRDQYGATIPPGQTPLEHFLRKGADGFNPNPLFDTSYYLKQYPDVRATRQNPLIHYIDAGALEGRNPSPFFDSLFYLRKNPKLRALGINPLAHYLVRGGAAEGRDPNAFFSTVSYLRDHPELEELGINPLVHFTGMAAKSSDRATHEVSAAAEPSEVRFQFRFLESNAAETRVARDDLATVFCVSHVSPHAPRAGNEYRISRLLQWLQTEGFETIPIISPLPHDEFSDEGLASLAEQYGSALLCLRKGETTGILNELDQKTLAALESKIVPSYAEVLGEDQLHEARELDLLGTERTFCHDALIAVTKALVETRKSCIVVAEYVFMSRLLPVLHLGVLKVIDTHDVFSAKQRKVVAYGVSDGLCLSAGEERERLFRADLILAIQPEEQAELGEVLGGGRKVITAGVDFPVTSDVTPAQKPIITFVGSDNAMNAKGLRDFLRFAWPQVLDAVPEAQLFVAGKVCSSVKFKPRNVMLLGPVENLSELYREAMVVINPVLAGTGLKVKTLEALSFLRPLVTWPTGIDGLDPELAALCRVATDWFEFQERLIDILRDPASRCFSSEQVRTIQKLLSPEHAYSSLKHALEAFQPMRVATA